MIYLICILVGLYLVFDAFYLGAKSDKEYRNCMIAKYVGAAMSGAYLIYLSVKDLLFHWGLFDKTGHIFISTDAMQILLLFGLTIGFFMWPDTFWRGIGYLQIHQPKLHSWLLANFRINARRMTDKATQ